MYYPLASLVVAALAAAPAPPAVTVETNITYATVGGEDLQLDVARPAGPGPHPCVVCLHGGAWKYGHRSDVAGFTEQLARHGFVAATVSYRLAPKHKWPAQIEDAKTAVRFLRANAARFGIDPDRFGALGFSAGGHLAALLGTADKDAGFEGPLYPGQSSRVQCVVDFFGPADLALFCQSPGIERAYFRPFIGALFRDNPDVYRKASPIAHVSKDDPPFLIVHGTADLIVPVIHSERFRDRLAAAGVPVELLTVKGGGHGWGGTDALTTSAVTLKFLADHLLKPGVGK